jgi:DNA-binding winged helix-turn-helix (wHTH) protein
MDYFVQMALRFDRFTLDLRRGCLRAGDRDIDLRPKAFEVLCYLANNAGRLVPKQELYEAVWPAVTVCDDSLVQCIRELRYKLGDNDRRLIKTVSRRGYLMDAAVSAQALQSPSDGSRMQVAEAPQKLPTELRVPLPALSPTTTPKLRVWGAATLVPPLIAVVVTLGIDHGFFLTSRGPQSASPSCGADRTLIRIGSTLSAAERLQRSSAAAIWTPLGRKRRVVHEQRPA